MEIQIVLYPGFDDLDAVGPYEVLSMAGETGLSVATHLVTVEPEPGSRLEPRP